MAPNEQNITMHCILYGNAIILSL